MVLVFCITCICVRFCLFFYWCFNLVGYSFGMWSMSCVYLYYLFCSFLKVVGKLWWNRDWFVIDCGLSKLVLGVFGAIFLNFFIVRLGWAWGEGIVFLNWLSIRDLFFWECCYYIVFGDRSFCYYYWSFFCCWFKDYRRSELRVRVV